MPVGDELSDDYVASILAKDAKENSSKYSTVGLQAFLPQKSQYNAPKPNTRFLRNIIRETDSHNAALLAKENTEARNRLRNLRNDVSTSYRESRHKPGKQEHQGRDDKERPSKRRRVEWEDSSRDEHRSSRPRSQKDRKNSHPKPGVANDDARRSRRRSPDSEPDYNRGTRSRHHRIRSRSPSPQHRRRHRHRHSDRERRARSDSSSPHHHRPRRKEQSSCGAEKSTVGAYRPDLSPLLSSATDNDRDENDGKHKDSDSDPLADILGPLPPKKAPAKIRRGRGTFAGPSNMSSRFSSNYDPSTDILPDDSDPDDWDQALEALKDRQRWKQQGADRLREAGFGDDEIRKWEKTGRGVWGSGKVEGVDTEDAEIENVQWAKKGEGREWDRGKVVDSDGVVDVKAAWTES